ncbi:hypothetical protein QBC34DRAFT_411234 [Podospora aff. communis PSN243]|uniref:DUF7708 domain-containing protein n=1 Tax=Podospora aff. communis PSN243 TaxID=3040156 RepID=A0AAV9GGE3_9PEZI|nr:hypothetical protein QBC34DRAFT_411234 [Podospora aff. communis PSN243]
MENSLVRNLAQDGWIVENPGIVAASARDAFQSAQTLLCSGENKSLSQGLNPAVVPSTAEELMAAIQEAQKNYHLRRNHKAWKWITRLSSRVMFYAQVMDVMCQHHPEYVSLAWGLLKFVFIGVTNHETLIKELSKALCRVCEAIKHVQLQLLLYPSKDMKEQVGSLYAHLVKFATRALKWYREPRLLHAITSITKPYALRFKDTVDDIQDTIRQIDRIALSMSQAEQRQILLKLDESRKSSEVEQRQIRLELEATRMELRETRAAHSESMKLMLAEFKMAIDGAAQLQFSGLLDTNRKISRIELSQLMAFLSTSSLPSPDAVRNTLSATRKIRLRQTPNSQTLYHSPALQEWGALPTSSQLLIEAPFVKRHTIRDFAIDVIDLVSAANIPTAWVLDAKNISAEEAAPSDIVKYLASQVLTTNQTLMDERSASLYAARFQSARTEKEWFALLGSVMEGLQQVYLVIDLDLVDRLGFGPASWLSEFPKFFDLLKQRCESVVVKVAFVRTTKAEMGEAEPPDQGMRIRIPRRDSGGVRKVAGKRGGRRRKAFAKAVQTTSEHRDQLRGIGGGGF